MPIHENEVNRLLGMMVANLGSVPWSVKELNGHIMNMNKKCAVFGICAKGEEFSVVASINKSLTKYISRHGQLNDCLLQLLATIYATHKLLPEVLVVFA